MKKLLFAAFTIIILGSCYSCKRQDPLKYRGCVIVDKDVVWLQLKLTPKMRDSLNNDYLWILTVEEDAKHFNIGDTIR